MRNMGPPTLPTIQFSLLKKTNMQNMLWKRKPCRNSWEMEYTLHVHTAGVGGGERDTHCTSKLQAVDGDVLRRLLTVLILLHIWCWKILCTVAAETPECRKKIGRHQDFFPVVICISSSNVKPTFFQDRKHSFWCFCSKKDRIYSFLKQNSGSKQNVFYQYLKNLVQKLLFWSISKIFWEQVKVLFCL